MRDGERHPLALFRGGRLQDQQAVGWHREGGQQRRNQGRVDDLRCTVVFDCDVLHVVVQPFEPNHHVLGRADDRDGLRNARVARDHASKLVVEQDPEHGVVIRHAAEGGVADADDYGFSNQVSEHGVDEH